MQCFSNQLFDLRSPFTRVKSPSNSLTALLFIEKRDVEIEFSYISSHLSANTNLVEELLICFGRSSKYIIWNSNKSEFKQYQPCCWLAHALWRQELAAVFYSTFPSSH